MRAGLKYASMAALAFAIQPTLAYAQDDVERIQEQAEDEVFTQRPFVVTHQVSGQSHLHRRYKRASRQSTYLNLFYQQGFSVLTYFYQKVYYLSL